MRTAVATILLLPIQAAAQVSGAIVGESPAKAPAANPTTDDAQCTSAPGGAPYRNDVATKPWARKATSVAMALCCGSALLSAVLPNAQAQPQALLEVKRLAERATRLGLEGKDDEASAAVDEAMQIAERMGPEDLPVGAVLLVRMGLQLRRFEMERAEASGKRANAIFEKTLGPDFPHTGMARASLALGT